MNPFVLLIKPLIAAGVFVTKMLVAVGFVATEAHDPAATQATQAENVRVAVVPSDSGIESMMLEMPNGELFELTDTQAEVDSSPAHAPGRPTPRQRRVARTDLVAMLESTLGRTMRCDVSLPDDAQRGSAHCTVEQGESYDVVF